MFFKCTEILVKMSYAKRIQDFNSLHMELKNKFSKNTVFLDYFDNNWLNCREMWVNCYREKQFNLGETTNNRIESLNSHLKNIGNYSDTLEECYRSLMLSYEYFEKQKSFRRLKDVVKRPLFTRSDVIEVMKFESEINESVTYTASDYIVNQMNLSFEFLNFKFEKLPHSNTYSIQSDGHRNALTTIESCDCFRYVNKLLPCYHIFALRKHLNLRLFEKTLIPNQFDKDIYLKSSVLSSPLSKLDFKIPIRRYTPISDSKFVIARIETDKLANAISKSGEKTFKHQLSVVRDLTEAFAEKKLVKMTHDYDKSPKSDSDENFEGLPNEGKMTIEKLEPDQPQQKIKKE